MGKVPGSNRLREARRPVGAGAHDLRAAAAFARGMLGGDDAAIAGELEAAAAAARAAGERDAEATAENYRAVLAFRRGDYAAARAGYLAALAALEGSGDVTRAGNLRMNLASLLFHLGEYARCLELLGTTVALLRAAGAEAAATRARRNLAHLYLELGAYEQARGELRALRAAARRLGLDRHAVAAGALLGLVAARTGDLPGARAELAQARAAFSELGDRRSAAEVALDAAEAELALDPAGGLAAARRALDDVAAAKGADDALDVRARRLALAAEVAARGGDPAAAARALPPLLEALEQVRAQGGRHLEWTFHVAARAACRAAGDGAAADAHLRAALGILEAIAVELPPAERAVFWQDPRRRGLRERAAAAPVLPRDAGSTWLAGDPTQLFRILEINRRINSELDLSRLLELAMDAAVELTGAERGFLLLAEPGGGELRVAVVRNLSAAALGGEGSTDRDLVTPGDDARYSRSIAESVFRTGEPIVTQSARGDARFAEANSIHALRLESVLCIPVRVRGRTAGVLYLENRFHPGRFSASDLRLLLAFGDQVAIALENARLLAENARRAEDLAGAKAQIEALYEERGRLLSRRTEELAVARRDLEETRRRLERGTGAFGIVGRAPAMERVLAMIERVGGLDIPVLIEGESGTGKELVARALHQQGARRRGPLVSVNCGALPDALLESELFGHVRGAFTGADRDRRGLFQAAHGGTLFLDEIGDTPARMQVDLLRALQEKTIRPVGGTADVAVDVRVVAATNRPLEELVRAGTFREDLYYRLHVVAIALPPLRERVDDIPLLCDHFLDVIAVRMRAAKKGVTRAAMRRLMEEPWPGNVRQLEHVLMNACVMAEGDTLDVADVTLGAAAPAGQRSPALERRERERARILAALEECGWNKSRAADRLGLPRRTFYRRLARYGIA